MPKKRPRPTDLRPTRGSIHSVADLQDLDREIARKQSEIRAARAAGREARLQAGAGAANRATPDTQELDGAVFEDSPADLHEPDAELGLAALLQTRGAPLVEALERHSEGAREHAEATASYAFATAVDLGFGRAESEAVREAAMLHEVGQVYIPAEALAEAERERDEAETEAFEAYYEASYWLARRAEIPEHVCDWLLHVRERYDGTGPEGLPGEAIPIESRIIRAACVCQTALAAPVGPGEQPRRRAVEQLDSRAGGQLDPRVVAALVKLIERASATE
jgi:HD-GYP domain-containing protein (c-di-GMP phosphodiesterase class II)